MPPGGFSRQYSVRLPLWEAQNGRISEQGPRVEVDVHIPGHGGYSAGPTEVRQLKLAILGDPEAWVWRARTRARTTWAPHTETSHTAGRFKWSFIQEISKQVKASAPEVLSQVEASAPELLSPIYGDIAEFRLVLAVDNVIVREYTDEEAVDYYGSPTDYRLAEDSSGLLEQDNTELCILPRNSIDQLRKWWFAAGCTSDWCPVLSITPGMVCVELASLAVPDGSGGQAADEHSETLQCETIDQTKELAAVQQQMTELQSQKAAAVQIEDYDLAKQCKVQIETAAARAEALEHEINRARFDPACCRWNTAAEDQVNQAMQLLAQQHDESGISSDGFSGAPSELAQLDSILCELQSSQWAHGAVSLSSRPPPHSIEDLQTWFRRAGGAPSATHFPGKPIDVLGGRFRDIRVGDRVASASSHQPLWWANPVVRLFILGVHRRWDLGARMVQRILSFLNEVQFQRGWQSMDCGAVWNDMKASNMLACRIADRDRRLVCIDDYPDDPELLEAELQEMEEDAEEYELIAGDPQIEFWGGNCSPDNYQSLLGQWRTKDKGCFAGSGLVKMASGAELRIREVQPGDRVVSPSSDHKVASVDCVVSYPVFGAVKLCCVDGCWLTPDHFVKLGGEWQLPETRCRPELKNLEDGTLYNLMLRAEDGYSVLVDGVEAVTLGHQLHQGPLAHRVWGTAVRPFLKAQPGYPCVVFEEDQFTMEAILAANAARNRLA